MVAAIIGGSMNRSIGMVLGRLRLYSRTRDGSAGGQGGLLCGCYEFVVGYLDVWG